MGHNWPAESAKAKGKNKPSQRIRSCLCRARCPFVFHPSPIYNSTRITHNAQIITCMNEAPSPTHVGTLANIIGAPLPPHTAAGGGGFWRWPLVSIYTKKEVNQFNSRSPAPNRSHNFCGGLRFPAAPYRPHPCSRLLARSRVSLLPSLCFCLTPFAVSPHTQKTGHL